MKKNALILINLQIDFCPGGAMEVPEGASLMPIANELMKKFKTVIAAKDWHPANHGSFAGNHPWRHIGQTLNLYGLEQELFPMHCVQDTFGAHFHPALETDKITQIIHQGIQVELDGYSCFFDADRRRSTGLDAILKEKNIENVFIMGLATEGGVKNTVLDALDLGYTTFLITDGCKAWNKNGGEEKQAIKEMVKLGVTLIPSMRIVADLA